jgi:hypothetical protein
MTDPGCRGDRSDRIIAAWIALLLFGIYLLSFSGRLYSQDNMSMFSVTESLVKRGEFNTDQMWTLQKARNEIASDGESYAKYGYGASLFAVPLYALAFALPIFGLVQTTLLTSAVVITIAGALLFLAARRLNYSRGVSTAVALLLGLATPAWVYGKQFWSETFGIFTLFAAFYFLLSFREERRGRDAIVAGIALGLAVATRVTNAALVPFFAWYGFGGALKDRHTRQGLVWFALMLALAAFSIAWYNWVRLGSPLATGYRADESFDNPILFGLYGLLFSPGKGLFVYVPFLVVLPWAIRVLRRRARDEVFLALAIFAVYLVTFSTWYYWWGGTNWSSRFLVPTLPFLVLLVAPVVELVASKASRAFAMVFAALCLLSFAIEVLGLSVPSLAYRARMVRLSTNPDWDTIFLPQFSPLVGSLNLLRPSVLDFGWIRVLDNNVDIDWLPIVLTMAFIALCSLSLWALLAKQFASNLKGNASSRGMLLAMTMIAIALSLFSLYRYRDDFRFGGNDGYRALLQVVASEEQPRDVMVLDDDVFTPFFLNENRARVRWYGLSRDSKQWDDATRALMLRLSQQYSRVWFAYSDSTAALPDPARDWLDRSLRQVDQRDFEDGVHLVLYATGAPL